MDELQKDLPQQVHRLFLQAVALAHLPPVNAEEWGHWKEQFQCLGCELA